MSKMQEATQKFAQALNAHLKGFYGDHPGEPWHEDRIGLIGRDLCIELVKITECILAASGDNKVEGWAAAHITKAQGFLEAARNEFEQVESLPLEVQPASGEANINEISVTLGELAVALRSRFGKAPKLSEEEPTKP